MVCVYNGLPMFQFLQKQPSYVCIVRSYKEICFLDARHCTSSSPHFTLHTQLKHPQNNQSSGTLSKLDMFTSPLHYNYCTFRTSLIWKLFQTKYFYWLKCVSFSRESCASALILSTCSHNARKHYSHTFEYKLVNGEDTQPAPNR